jgi:hypothetical protein
MDLLNKLISLNTFFQKELSKPDEIKSKVLEDQDKSLKLEEDLLMKKLKLNFQILSNGISIGI